MNRLTEIEAAAEALPPEEQEELLRFLAERLHAPLPRSQSARLVRQGADALLEAPAGAPPMTPEYVRRILEDWP
jgi:uncharacterized membrane protein